MDKPTPSAIETVNGIFIDLLNPDPDDIWIDDIAWSLSRMPRYMAHTVLIPPYTIGQHSIACVELLVALKNGDPDLIESFTAFLRSKKSDLTDVRIEAYDLLHTLLHDASEAYIVDVPTPLKQIDEFAAIYGRLERQMMRCIWKAFELKEYETGSPTDMLVKWADAFSLSIEAYHLMKTRGNDWTRLIPVTRKWLNRFKLPADQQEV